jgi:hypothetical protein
LRANNPIWTELGTGNFLDLTGGTRAVVDHHTLTESEVNNVPISRNLGDGDRGRRRDNGKSHAAQNQYRYAHDGPCRRTKELQLYWPAYDSERDQ